MLKHVSKNIIGVYVKKISGCNKISAKQVSSDVFIKHIFGHVN